MKPARTLSTENIFPIDIAALQLGRGRMSAVGTSECGADAKSALGEVQTIAHGATDAIVGNPADQRLIHPALVDKGFDQAADRIVGKSCNDGSVEAKASFQAPGNVILPPAFGDIKVSRGPNASVAGIEAQHH